MKSLDLSEAFSSRARFRLLQTLTKMNSPLPIRHLERFTGLAIRSVQVALRGLEEEKLVDRNNGFYRLNLAHPLCPILKKIFALITEDQIETRANELSQKAREALRFADEMRTLTNKAKKT